MHIIIGNPRKSAENLGGKGLNLIKLDELGLTPDFLMISASVLHKAALQDPLLSACLKGHVTTANPENIRKRILTLREDRQLREEIEAGLKKLGPGKLIFRSSFSAEDSARASYAGLFSSFVCSGKFDSFTVIKKIWAGQFGRNAILYRPRGGNHTAGMSVVVQKFLKPDHSGVCFFDPAEGGQFYIEHCEKSYNAVELGKTKPAAYLWRKERSYSTSPDDEAHSGWLRDLIAKVRVLSAAFRASRLDIEFAVVNGKVSLLQSRPLTTSFNAGARHYVFSRAHQANYNPEDFSSHEFGDILKSLRLPVPKEIKKTGTDVFIYGNSFFKLDDMLAKRAGDPLFTVFFKRKFLDFFLVECAKMKTLGKKNTATLFFLLKRICFRMSIFDYVHVTLQKELENALLKKYGARWMENNIGHFMPQVSFTTSRIFSDIEEGKSFPFFYSEKEAAAVLKNAAGAVDFSQLKKDVAGNMARRRGRSASIQGLAKKYAPALRDLLDLRDKVDYYYALITGVYHKHISIKTRFTGDIAKISKLPAAGLTSFLADKMSGIRTAAPAPLERRAAAFPLSGIVACRGSVRGRAVVINNFSDISKVGKGDILVARYTRPDLFMGMVVSGGVITAEGGLTSHAAIVSRELNKPCLVGVSGCLTAIKNGDMLRIHDGKVYRTGPRLPKAGSRGMAAGPRARPLK